MIPPEGAHSISPANSKCLVYGGGGQPAEIIISGVGCQEHAVMVIQFQVQLRIEVIEIDVEIGLAGVRNSEPFKV